MKTKSVVLKRFEQLLELKYSGSTPKNYVGYVSDFLDFAKNVPNRVTNEDFLEYNISINDKSPSYQQCAISAVKAYFRFYLRKKVKGFACIRPPKQKTLPEVYDFETVNSKINNIENIKHKSMLHLALSTWMRQGEVKNLKLSDIDGDKKTIFIRNSKGCKDGEIDISKNTLILLRKYYQKHKPETYLFEGENGRYSSLNKVCQNHLGFRFHCLRATGANHAHLLGFSLYDISKKLRHSQLKTTEHYLRANIKKLVII